MSKITFFFQWYSILTLLTLALLTPALLLLGAVTISADQQDDFTVKQDPDPISISDKNITITVTKKDGSDYFVGTKYSFAAWKGDNFDKQTACTTINFSTFEQGASKGQLQWDAKKAVAQWNIPASCFGISDVVYFRLWAGDGWGDMNNENNIIIKDYPFAFTQQGGTLISISAKNPDVYAGQKPVVIMSNVNPGEDYTFWWDGDPNVIAAYYSSDKNPANPLEVSIPNFSTDRATRKLCMEYGRFRWPPGRNDCNPFVTFNFKTGQPPPAPSGAVKCTILPSTNLPLRSEVNLKIENLPNGTRVAAYALDQAKTDPESTAHGTVDSTNTVTLNLLKNASNVTSYTVVAYNEADPSKNMCVPNPTVIIGAAIAPPGVDKCKNPNEEQAKGCSKAGGQTDPACKNGFITAIGCIHTTPKAFVEDVLKFATGIGGGLAFMMMLFGAFQMMKSAGNPQSLQEGKDVFTNAIIGILFIIFSILLMKIIGIDILSLPGFSNP